MRFRRLMALGLCLSFGLAAAGCGGGQSGAPITEENRDDVALRDVAEIYRVYTFEKKKPPKKIADLRPFEQMSPVGFHAIEDGSVVVRYGAVMNSVSEGPSTDPDDEVLAYAREVPEQGGPVLMLNRKVKTMTPEEFKAAKLAGTGDSTGGEKASKSKGGE